MAWEVVKDHPKNKWILSESEKPKTMMDSIAGALSKVPGVSKFAEEVEPVSSGIISAMEKSRIPSFAGGFLQGAGETAKSTANLPLQALSGHSLPSPHLQQYVPQDILSKGAFTGGELAGSLLLPGAIFKLLGKASPTLSGVPRIISDILKGSATGAITGEDLPGGRAGGAALGGLAEGANLLRPKEIAKKILEGKNKAQSLYAKKYKDFFGNAENLGIKEIDKPKTDLEFMNEHIPNSYMENVNKFYENPNPENAHWAQSDLKSYIRKQFGKTDLPSNVNKAIKMAKETEYGISSNLNNKFGKVPELSNIYEKLGQGYKTDVVPYKNKAISSFLKGDISESKMVKGLLNNNRFMKNIGSFEYPELGAHQILKNKLIQAGLLGGAAGAGFYVPNHYFGGGNT